MKIRTREQSELPSPPLLRELFLCASGSAIVENRNGKIRTESNVGAARLRWLWDKHEAGHGRFGISPVRSGGSCRWGAIDLDAHGAGEVDRLVDAQAVAAGLRVLKLTPYLERSRGGRGWHVWILLDEPGASARDLYRVMHDFAQEVGNADYFPSSPSGRGKAILMPGFAGAPLLDADLVPVDLGRIKLDDPSLIKAALGDSASRAPRPTVQWRRFWARPASSRTRCAELDDVWHLLFAGPDGMLQAHKGARHKIAGMTAKKLIRRRGTFADFCNWDSRNRPPLASDKPHELDKWWKWAEGDLQKEQKG